MTQMEADYQTGFNSLGPADRARVMSTGGFKTSVRGKGKDTATLWVQSAVLPCVLFIMVEVLFTYTYHRVPAMPWAGVGAGVILAVFGCWPVPKAQQGTMTPLPRTRLDFTPIAYNLLAVAAGCLVGMSNYNTIAPWVNIRHLAHYTGVRPGANPAAYVDAGILAFAPDTRLDTTQAVGFDEWPHRYCVAPIFNSDLPEPASFWAAGIDCCDLRGAFWCDDAAVDSSEDEPAQLEAVANAWSTHSAVGVRILGSTDPLTYLFGGVHHVGETYRKAARMAGATYGLNVPKDPIIVMWTKDPDAKATWAFWKATIGVVLAGIVAAICSVLFGRVMMASAPGF